MSKLPKQPSFPGPEDSRQSSRADTRQQHAGAPVKENFLPVTGIVHHQTSLGVFLEVARRRVFVPINCMSAPSAVFEAGEPAVISVLRSFAEQERLIPLDDSNQPYARKATNLRHNTIQTLEQKGRRPSRLRILRDRLVAMCVVETKAARQSGMNSWKTKPCRLLLRLLAKAAH